MKRILVTGCCGFIGSNFIRHILTQQPQLEVVNLDKLTYAGNAANLRDLRDDPRHQLVRGDICDARLVDSLCADGFDACVNFAAESHVDRSILDASAFIQTNIVGTQILLEAARQHGVERFVQISTDEVYGSLGPTGYFTEQTPLAPNSPYSASKAAADMLVRAAFHTHGQPVMITRCSNNYGPYQFPEKLIPLFVTNALNDVPVPLYGDGLNVRDWIYVLDHCRGIESVLLNGTPGAVYNFGGRCEKTNREITDTILRLLDKPATLIKYVADRKGHDRRYAIDCAYAEQELGWRPAMSFEEGIRRTIQWYQDNLDWVESVKSGEYLKYYEQQYGARLAAK